jgi:hypothetical protein
VFDRYTSLVEYTWIGGATPDAACKFTNQLLYEDDHEEVLHYFKDLDHCVDMAINGSLIEMVYCPYPTQKRKLQHHHHHTMMKMNGNIVRAMNKTVGRRLSYLSDLFSRQTTVRITSGHAAQNTGIQSLIKPKPVNRTIYETGYVLSHKQTVNGENAVFNCSDSAKSENNTVFDLFCAIQTIVMQPQLYKQLESYSASKAAISVSASSIHRPNHHHLRNLMHNTLYDIEVGIKRERRRYFGHVGKLSASLRVKLMLLYERCKKTNN